jgi:hypothetical protein
VAQPHTFSPDGRWRWDGTRWVAVKGAGPWTWARRIGSLVVGLLLLFGAGTTAIGLAVARPIDPVRIEGNLTRFVKDCPVPGDIGDQCAFIDSDPYCYRLHPDNFQPALPSLSDGIGQPITFIVDRNNYESSRTVGDPYCNFEVGQVIVTISGRQTRYSTRAMTEPQFVGHARSDILPLFVAMLIAFALLMGWNATMEIRRYRQK